MKEKLFRGKKFNFFSGLKFFPLDHFSLIPLKVRWGEIESFVQYSPVLIFLYLWYDLQYLIQLHTKLIIYIDIMDILPHILIIYSTAKGTIKKYLQILYSYSELSVCGLKWTRSRQTENKRTGHIYFWPKSFLYTG